MPTIAITLKVHDGVVLATDSATTLTVPGRGVVNIYNSADKIFNLHRELPIGAITWGSGGIGRASIATLAKDLRNRLMGEDREHQDWMLDADHYTMEEVAGRAKEFLFDELYSGEYANLDDEQKPFLGFLVAGYSAYEGLAEEWKMEILSGQCESTSLVRPKDDTGISWFGDPEAITRLMFGFGTGLPAVLSKLGVPQEQIGPAMDRIKEKLQVVLIAPPMPIKDVIELGEFLVGVTTGFHRFAPGPATVGGPAQVAAITKHEGFRWVKRSLYFEKSQQWEGANEIR